MTITIELTLDGNKFCALVGENIQEGVAGFGDSPADAIRDLADNMMFQLLDMSDPDFTPADDLDCPFCRNRPQPVKWRPDTFVQCSNPGCCMGETNTLREIWNRREERELKPLRARIATLEREKAELLTKLAYAEDAANKGDEARSIAGALEERIRELEAALKQIANDGSDSLRARTIAEKALNTTLKRDEH